MSYIDRELLLIGVDGCISALHAYAKGDLVQDEAIKLVEATRDYIASLSTADVVEVRHGRWFFTEYEFFTCSVCGESYYNGAESTAQAESYLNSGHTYKYCPNCGARMDEGGRP